IDLAEFNQLLNIIAIKFQKEESEPWLSRYSFCNSVYSEMLKGFVKSPKFKYVIVFVLLLNLAALIAETRLDIQNKSGHKSWQKVEFVFVIGETLTIVSPKELKFFSNEEWIQYLLIVRVLRFIRLVMHVQRIQYLLIVRVLRFIRLAMHIFGGLVNAGNSDLPSTDLAHSKYPTVFAANFYVLSIITKHAISSTSFLRYKTIAHIWHVIVIESSKEFQEYIVPKFKTSQEVKLYVQ
ncbi:hypothetical protein Tco_0168291, partial [Tanacetum coccineum]